MKGFIASGRSTASAKAPANEGETSPRRRAMETLAALSAIVGQKPIQQCKETAKLEMDAMVVFLEMGLGVKLGLDKKKQPHQKQRLKQQLEHPNPDPKQDAVVGEPNTKPDSMVVLLEFDPEPTKRVQPHENPMVSSPHHCYHPPLRRMEANGTAESSSCTRSNPQVDQQATKKVQQPPENPMVNSPHHCYHPSLPTMAQVRRMGKNGTADTSSSTRSNPQEEPQEEGEVRKPSNNKPVAKEGHNHKVRFHNMVAVVEIPSYRDMDQDVVQSVWSSSREIHRNCIRNNWEYNWVGRDWTKVVEEDQMIHDPVSGEHIHPATWELMEIERQRHERELEALRLARDESERRQRLWVEAKKKKNRA